MGKSSLAVNIASNIAVNQNTPVGIFSLEMSNDQIIDRLIAGFSNETQLFLFIRFQIESVNIRTQAVIIRTPKQIILFDN